MQVRYAGEIPAGKGRNELHAPICIAGLQSAMEGLAGEIQLFVAGGTVCIQHRVDHTRIKTLAIGVPYDDLRAR